MHRDTCTHTQARTDTDTHAQTHVDTHRYMYTQTHVRTYTQTHTRTIVHAYTDTHKHTHMYTHTPPPPPIKSCSTSLFTHRAGYCTLGGGREHDTHSLLCFHCAHLLSNTDGSQCQ
ncbi:unnamed protein product [Staurois parvus]|uniref:Uncharacterized protein n=1 Tax=Staurois parvus TaxID=386267 RepID=A0ABN9ATH5_9NEOB|nr:unnamed protein product [Staurois parvus]